MINIVSTAAPFECTQVTIDIYDVRLTAYVGKIHGRAHLVALYNGDFTVPNTDALYKIISNVISQSRL